MDKPVTVPEDDELLPVTECPDCRDGAEGPVAWFEPCSRHRAVFDAAHEAIGADKWAQREYERTGIYP